MVRRSLEGGLLSRIWQGVRFPPMGPNGWRMPKLPKFSSVLMHCNCAPCKPTAIFFEKNAFFVVHFAFWVLIGSRDCHRPRGRLEVASSPKIHTKPKIMSDIEFHIKNGVVPSTRPAAHIVSIAPACHPGVATLNHRLENPARN